MMLYFVFIAHYVNICQQRPFGWHLLWCSGFFFFMSLDRLWKMLVSFCTRLATKHVDAYTSIFGEMEVLMGSREARKASRSQDPNNRIISITYTRRRVSNKNHQHKTLLQLQRYNYTFGWKYFEGLWKKKTCTVSVTGKSARTRKNLNVLPQLWVITYLSLIFQFCQISYWLMIFRPAIGKCIGGRVYRGADSY